MARAFTLTILVGLALSAPVAQAAPSGNLYLQQVAGGQLQGKKLVLRGVSARTVQFADRPERRGGSLSTRRFVGEWKRDFRGDPPNAALEVVNAPRGRDVALLELRNPRYNPIKRTLVYSVRHLKGLEGDRFGGLERRGDHRGVSRFGRATLFIDPGLPTAPIAIFAHVPAGQALRIQLSDAAFDYSSTFIPGIRTPAVDNNGFFETSTGLIVLRPTAISFEASTGGGGLSAQLITFVEVPVSKLLTGAATIPSGGSLEFANAGKQPVRIPSGPFSFPIEEE